MSPSLEESTCKYTLLCEAVKNNEKSAVQQLLSNNAPVNLSIVSFCNTPLHLAVSGNDNIDIIAMLLDKGANINIVNQHNQTPLETVLGRKREDVLTLFVEKGVFINKNFELIVSQLTQRNNEESVRFIVDFAIKKNISLNLVDAVYIAAESGDIHILEYLLFSSKAHYLKDQFIPSEIVMKDSVKSKNITDLLFQHGFTIDCSDKANFIYVYTAVEKKCVNIVKDILQYGMDVNAIHKDTGLAFIHLACLNEDIEMAKLLIDYDANVNMKVVEKQWIINPEFFNKTPLFISVNNCDVKLTELLLMNGADPKEEPNIFFIALQQSTLEIIKILLRYGIDVDGTDYFGRTPLYYTIVKYSKHSGCFTHPNYCLNDDEINEEIVELLIKNGANPNINHNGNSPLQGAIRQGYLNIVKLLLNYNVDVNHSDSCGNTPLHCAADGDTKFLDLLLMYSPNINAANLDYRTPLHLVSIGKKCNSLEKLLENNANVNDVDKNGDTPLHLACRGCNSLNVVQVLVSYDANIHAKNKNEETPLHTIALHNWIFNISIHKGIVETLIKHKADINCVDNLGRTPLIIACKKGNESMVEILLKHDVEIDCKDLQGMTPLIVAYEQGYEKIFKLLIKRGADVNGRNIKGMTSLRMTFQELNASNFEYLLTRGADINAIYNNKTVVSCIKDMICQIRIPVHYWNKIDKIVAQNLCKIYSIAREHVIKLKCAKLKVNKEALDIFYTDDDLQNRVDIIVSEYRFEDIKSISQIEKQCEDEIETLKSIQIEDIILYNLLTKDIHDMTQFANNQQIIYALQSDKFKNKFPLYGAIIKSKFFEATKKNKLIERAKKYSVSTNLRRLPLTCVNQIFSYLSSADLKAFICAFSN